ncbi:PEP/pyruvate-binding domain-containing protein [Desulfonatronum thioautotrophicum]|uniref:PEP/pyruvate-binding domain-containing protein n=1 Tax=Desulfonatronum thioautotrophicum TaxID=617001 RepID=UPI00069C8F97|nr:PEP/pyruvate-binding domain-containing protein [Desulfonatronum thioautotrophicum]
MALASIKRWAERVFTPDEAIRRQFSLFQELLHEDKLCLKNITRLEEIGRKPILVDWSRVELLTRHLLDRMDRLADRLQHMAPEGYPGLAPACGQVREEIEALLGQEHWRPERPYVLHLEKGPATESAREIMGGKAQGLAQIIARTDIPVPPAMVLTTNAYQRFLEANGLRKMICKKLLTLDLRRPERLERIAAQIREAIQQGDVPEDMAEDVEAALDRLSSLTQALPEGNGKVSSEPLFAVRSSALAEDGDASFAGQYTTRLNVSRQDFWAAYKDVLAGKFSTKTLTYRLHYGLSDAQTAMAALVLPMIQAKTSGVVYSRDPLDLCKGACLVISAVAGAGSRLVDGSAVPDTFLVSRKNPAHFLAKQAAPEQNNPPLPSLGEQLCLDDASATSLARWGLELEEIFERPQDIEWTQDHSGGLMVLQSRPIHVPDSTRDADLEVPVSTDGPDDGDDTNHSTPQPSEHVGSILDVGTPASTGIAVGPIHRITSQTNLDTVPQGAVVVAPGIPPSLVQIIHKAAGVIAEQGGKASHFASVAREFGLPVIVGFGSGAAALEQDRLVTIDAHRGVVYDGEIQELLQWQKKQLAKPVTPFQRQMAPLLQRIASLNLTDPEADTFTPKHCRSVHDVVRFVHEHGTREMFSLMDTKGRGMRRAKPLESEIPIVMHVLDLGQGLCAGAENERALTLEHVRSGPMLAVWSGLTDKDVAWSEGLLHLDWERFDQVSGGIFSLKSSLLSSYALLGRHYAHLLLRFGYHFAVLDTLAGERAEENYIQFRFKGGGGADEKKNWRLEMIQGVLQAFDFQVRIREDLLEAKCARLDRQRTELRLNVLGYLLGRTPLLDMALESRDHALRLAEEMRTKWNQAEERS